MSWFYFYLRLPFGLFCLGGGGGGVETAHLAFLLFVNFVFSMHPFFLFGVLVGR